MKILLNLSLLIILLTSQSLGFEINFENINTIDELVQIYAQKYPNQGLSEEALLRKATEEWVAQVRAEYKGVEPLDALPAQIVEADGVEYHLYGFAHGNPRKFIESPNGNYLEFVLKAFEKEKEKGGYIFAEQTFNLIFEEDEDSHKLIEVFDYVIHELCYGGARTYDFVEVIRLIENGINAKLIYRRDNRKQRALGITPQNVSLLENVIATFNRIFECGKEEYFDFYMVLEELLLRDREGKLNFWEYFDLATGKVDGNYYGLLALLNYHKFNKTLHTLDLEIRQALEENKLPTHLDAQLVMKNTKMSPELVIHRRSAYMAGFLKGFAKAAQVKKVPFFTGAGHMALVKGFLMDTSKTLQQNPYFEIGFIVGKRLGVIISRIDENDSEALRKLLLHHWKVDPIGKDTDYFYSAAGFLTLPVIGITSTLYLFSLCLNRLRA